MKNSDRKKLLTFVFKIFHSLSVRNKVWNISQFFCNLRRHKMYWKQLVLDSLIHSVIFGQQLFNLFNISFIFLKKKKI